MTDRPGGRAPDALRGVRFTRDFTRHAAGSVLVEFGDTRVICTASLEAQVPAFLKGRGSGWVTAEYGMLPRATSQRMAREAARGKQGGRTLEIQRLIGRSLRQALDLQKLGERSVTLDCDVIKADGGTRTAAITGAWVALRDALRHALKQGVLTASPLRHQVAAVSVGIHRGEVLLDLDYAEDSAAETDLNLVMNDRGGLIEVQGTAEDGAYSREQLDRMLDLGAAGIDRLFALQREVIDGI